MGNGEQARVSGAQRLGSSVGMEEVRQELGPRPWRDLYVRSRISYLIQNMERSSESCPSQGAQVLYTFEAFQRLFLKLDCTKLFPKGNTFKSHVLA